MPFGADAYPVAFGLHVEVIEPGRIGRYHGFRLFLQYAGKQYPAGRFYEVGQQFGQFAQGACQDVGHDAVGGLHLALDNADCAGTLKLVADSRAENDTNLINGICEDPALSQSSMDADTGTIHLQRVSYENAWYQADLEKNASGYGVTDRVYLGPIDPASVKDHCHAYFGNSELIIPVLKDGDTNRAMRMTLIPGKDWQFEVVEDN